MFEYAGNEGRLANWLQAQNQSDNLGIFPPSKGWRGELKPVVVTSEGQCAYQWDFWGEEEHYAILVLGSLADEIEKLDLKSWKKQTTQATQAFIFSSQKQAPRLLAQCQAVQLPLLALSQDKAEFLHGEWENKRLEFRNDKYCPNPDQLPNRIGPFPSRHACGEEALPLFQAIFQQINLALAQGLGQISLEEILSQATPLWPLLPKREKRAISNFTQTRLQEMEAQFFKGLWVLQSEKKKEQSQPKIAIKLLFQKEERKLVGAMHKGEVAALRWLRLEQPQMSLNEDLPT